MTKKPAIYVWVADVWQDKTNRDGLRNAQPKFPSRREVTTESSLGHPENQKAD